MSRRTLKLAQYLISSADSPAGTTRARLELADRYRNPGMGYGDAKQALYELILDHFADARKRRKELMNDPGYVDKVLKDGAVAAQEKVSNVTTRARRAVGL